MIRERVGDLLQSDANIIAHQTNCMGVMGAGVALQIKNKLLDERAFEKYVDLCKRKGEHLLGHVQYLQGAGEKVIANVFGEYKPSYDKVDTDYDSLKEALILLHEEAKKYELSVAIPGLMGCGLAGGDWNIVRDMIEEIFGDSEVPLEIVFFSKEDYEKWHRC